MAITQATSQPTSALSQTQRQPTTATAIEAPTKNQPNNLKLNDMSTSVRGAKPPSTFLVRFLMGRKLGSGILPHMPCELVEMIAVQLPMNDLGNLRLVCRELESKTLWYFANTYFTEVKFMPSKYALRALQAMSESRMSKYVRTLALGPPPNDQGNIVFLGGDIVSPSEQEEIISQMWKYSEENRQMRNWGEDADMIYKSLQNLHHITTLNFIDASRWGSCPIHVSYGGHYMHKKVGAGLGVFQPVTLDSTQSLARIFSITLRAAQAANLNVERIDAHMTDIPQSVDEHIMNGFSACALDFPIVQQIDSSVSSFFANLSVLKINIAFKGDAYPQGGREHFLDRFTTFISLATSIRTLGITFTVGVGSMELLEQLTYSGALKNIKKLELAGVSVTSGVLFFILEPLRSNLCGLSMNELLLLDGAYIELLVWLRDNMSLLMEIDMDYFCEEFPSPIFYDGTAMSEFLETTIGIWTEEKVEFDHEDLSS
ncbi:hypothetical protein K505DRAFT_334999 [Melanomma pulvis-pyrius CBS 109.77]|uniref:F-box domain-containing protein n=1 Tax=Melanomma pulvis-pyrius CBS 109.77 TaxID=1314802 RepID=A0A6A6XJA4_9PLEO|nr:hypothetical protein K505DRAFT_334999 [Melanomma pulvis-pyrius CBS 109.77]